MRPYDYIFLVPFLLLPAGCNKPTPVVEDVSENSTTGEELDNAQAVDTAKPFVRVIEVGPDAQAQAQEALITAEPGDLIEFGTGTFDFNGTLSLNGVAGVSIRGQGMEETIINFTGQRRGSGGEGFLIKADRFTIEDLTIQNTPGDAIKISDSNEVTIRRVRTWWSDGASEENGAYGIYPVMCSDVLIEYCVAQFASDAGIYVGQTRRAIIRHNRAEQNVAGIEIENTVGADVYENDATNNTGGILVFSLPGLELKNGSHTRVFKNRLLNNNHPNFAQQGAMVATVPSGTGLMIMANDHVEVFENIIQGHQTANCAIVSFFATQRKFDDPQYDPYPEAISIHNNQFSNGGTDPQGLFGDVYRQGGELPMPDIVIDGIFNPEKLVDGRLPAESAFCISSNNGATFVNLGLSAMLQGGSPQISLDASPFACERDPLPEIRIPAVE